MLLNACPAGGEGDVGDAVRLYVRASNPNAQRGWQRGRGPSGRGKTEQNGAAGCVCLSVCLSQIVWRSGGVGMSEGPGLSLSLKPWQGTAQTETQDRADGVKGGLKVAQLAQG